VVKWFDQGIIIGFPVLERTLLRDDLDWECAAIRMVIGCRGGNDDCRAATRMQALS
jgi:hypothetical protein